MANTADILNLPSLTVLHVDEVVHDYHVYAQAREMPAACQHCGDTGLVGFGKREQLVRDLSVHGKRVGIYLSTRRFRCRDCGRTFYESVRGIDERRNMTTRLLTWIGQQSIQRPFAHLADEIGITEGTVRAIFHDYINELEQRVRFETPQWMGIDEIHIIHKPRAVVGNIENNTLVEILPNRDKATVIKYLSRLPQRERVRFVAMDMWRPYLEAVTEVLPQTTVVVDKFHVLRMANVAMEQVRKAHRATLKPNQRRALMHDRFVLLKRPEALTAQQQRLLDGWLANYPLLKAAYQLKEQFFGLYDAPGHLDAMRRYQAWQAAYEAASAPVKLAFNPLVTACGNWSPQIFNYFTHRITNAFPESMNNLIRLMNRLGRGYSFEALRAKALFTDRLHKTKRPAFERRTGGRGDTMDYFVFARQTLSTFQQDRKINYGVDISTLTRLLEDGRL